MDGTGREQDQNAVGGHPLPEGEGARTDDVPETLKRNKGEGDSGVTADTGNLDFSEGAPLRAESKQAVRNQAVVSPGDYGGTSESGV